MALMLVVVDVNPVRRVVKVVVVELVLSVVMIDVIVTCGEIVGTVPFPPPLVMVVVVVHVVAPL